MTQNQNVRTLSASQLERYRRNIDIPGFGERGQRALLDSKVLVVGAGATAWHFDVLGFAGAIRHRLAA